MTITYHRDVLQGSEEWLAMRRGILTASEVHLILTPTLKTARNEKTRAHLYELLAQRLTDYVEPHYVSDDMLRGQDDEIAARQYYHDNHAPVTECGFVTREFAVDGVKVKLGYSPDGLVGDDGLLECKSRRQKYQVQTFLNWHRSSEIPAEYALQVQTGMLVTQRQWLDLVSYSGGLPVCVMRVHADQQVHAAILGAAVDFERELLDALDDYQAATCKLTPTPRRVVQEMF